MGYRPVLIGVHPLENAYHLIVGAGWLDIGEHNAPLLLLVVGKACHVIAGPMSTSYGLYVVHPYATPLAIDVHPLVGGRESVVHVYDGKVVELQVLEHPFHSVQVVVKQAHELIQRYTLPVYSLSTLLNTVPSLCLCYYTP
jgi:hypothetical protein